MIVNLVRTPIVIGAVISGALVLLAVAALVTSSPRWDDHLINAIGVFIAGLFVSLTLALTIAAFRQQPGVSRRRRVINILLFVALAICLVIAGVVAWFINNMSFL